MLVLRTTDNWTLATLAVTVGASSATYTPASTVQSAYDAVVGFVAWANDAARAWFGSRVFSWTWARDAATGGGKLTISATGGSFALAPSATAITLLGLLGASGSSLTGATPAAGTWAPAQASGRLSVTGDYRMLGAGDAAAVGALRPGVPGTALRSPTVEALGTPTDVARLTEILRTARSPRRAWVWQSHTSSWLDLALGPEERSRVGHLVYRSAFEARAGTLLGV